MAPTTLYDKVKKLEECITIEEDEAFWKNKLTPLKKTKTEALLAKTSAKMEYKDPPKIVTRKPLKRNNTAGARPKRQAKGDSE